MRAVSPETEALLTAGEEGKQAAAQQGEQAELGEAEARRKANVLQSGFEQSQQISADLAERHRKAAENEQQRDYDALAKEADSAKPDYDRFMRSKGWAGRAAAAIFQGLGAAGAALTHSPNFAKEIIDGAINRDIEQQRDELANKRAGVRQKAAGLEQMRQRFGDERLAEAAERARQLHAFSLIGDNIVSSAHDQTLSANWAGTNAQLKTEQGKLHEIMFPYQQPAGEAQQLDLAQKRANIVKTMAEAEKATPEQTKEADKQKQLTQLQDLGKAMIAAPSTSFTGGHPVNYATSKLGIQGTEGQKANAAIDAWNDAVKLHAHLMGVRLGDPEHAAQFLRGVTVDPNDNPATRLLKFRTGMQVFGAEQASTQTPGYQIRPPGSAKEPQTEGGPPALTRADPAEMQSANARAMGPGASPAAIRMLAAQSALETAGGKSMYGYNFGGIKGVGPGGLSHKLMTTEVENGKEKRLPQQFRAYGSLDEGASDYVNFIRQNYPEAYQRAIAGDVAGYAKALKQRGYYTQDEAKYLEGLRSRL